MHISKFIGIHPGKFTKISTRVEETVHYLAKKNQRRIFCIRLHMVFRSLKKFTEGGFLSLTEPVSRNSCKQFTRN